MRTNIFRKFLVFGRRKFRVLFKKHYSKKDIELLKDTNFIIISNNCWGGEVYQWFKRPYNTPFIGLHFKAPCYLKLLSNFEYYMSVELSFIDKSKYSPNEVQYPIGKLDDIELHFRHYKSKEEAENKWTRRKARLLENTDLDNYYFKICDTYGCTEQILTNFHKLPFKNKVSFGLHNFKSLEKQNHIVIQESHKKRGEHVPNGVKLFKLTFLYFNITKWLMN